MGTRNIALCLMTIVLLFLIPTFLQNVNANELEAVEGLGCYAYGDDETPSDAKAKAMARAREQAVSSYKVWVESSSEVKDFQLKEDSIQSISAGMLQQVHIEDIKKDGQEICITITGMLDPVSVQEEIERRIKQKDIKDVLLSPALNPGSSTGLKIWLNQADGRYLEDEHLEIYVESNQDAYLKLDYFQADGTVVHLVPNMFRKQARILKGQRYVFGGSDSPERFVISGPYGDEVIKAVASTRPFAEDLQVNDVVSESQTYVKTLEKGLKQESHKKGTRGVRIMFGASAALFTTSREILHHKEAIEGKK